MRQQQQKTEVVIGWTPTLKEGKALRLAEVMADVTKAKIMEGPEDSGVAFTFFSVKAGEEAVDRLADEDWQEAFGVQITTKLIAGDV